MGQVQETVLRFIGIALVIAGGLCIVRGAFSVHKGSAGGNDDINIAGWKSMGSWWAMGGVMLTSGSYLTFMRLINNVFQYLF